MISRFLSNSVDEVPLGTKENTIKGVGLKEGKRSEIQFLDTLNLKCLSDILSDIRSKL